MTLGGLFLFYFIIIYIWENGDKMDYDGYKKRIMIMSERRRRRRRSRVKVL